MFDQTSWVKHELTLGGLHQSLCATLPYLSLAYRCVENRLTRPVIVWLDQLISTRNHDNLLHPSCRPNDHYVPDIVLHKLGSQNEMRSQPVSKVKDDDTTSCEDATHPSRSKDSTLTRAVTHARCYVARIFIPTGRCTGAISQLSVQYHFATPSKRSRQACCLDRRSHPSDMHVALRVQGHLLRLPARRR